MNSYYSADELAQLGLKSYGNNVLISRKASIYSPGNISVGNNVRVDDFSILSGKITIGDYVHINPYIGIFAGNSGVELEDYVNLSSRISIYAISDDYSGEVLTTPLLPDSRKYQQSAAVLIKKFVIIGTGTSILPGVTIEEGCAIGAMSLVNKTTLPWGIYAGIPVKRIKERKRELLKYLPK